MPKVLLITYHYPPSRAIGGLRPHGLAKYLPDYGWETVVLTPAMPGGKRPGEHIIETGNRDVLQQWKARLGLNPGRELHKQLHLPLSTKADTRLLHTRAIDWLKRWLAYPDPTKGWIPFADEAIQEFAKRERVDAILSTSPPESCHLIAARAKTVLGVPWIADFRDLWTQNMAEQKHSSLPLRVRLEKKTLARADVLVTVSAPWAERLRGRYPNKPIETVTNGFDPEDFVDRPARLTKTFSITYAGQLYEGKRDPSPLFEVVAELVQARLMDPDLVRIRFYGQPEPWLSPLIARYGLQNVVELHGVIARSEALQREMESQVLLMLGWNDPLETGQHTGKLFEYFGAARPIIALGGGRGVLTEALEETGAGVHALSREQLRESLLAMYKQFLRDGNLTYPADQEALERYDHPHMAARFAEILNRAAGRATSDHSSSLGRAGVQGSLAGQGK
jgi:glycosyltransferase involved in cell wall biosynthesis